MGTVDLHFGGLLLSKGYTDLDEKGVKSYDSWQLTVMWSLKKRLVLVFKNDMKKLVNFDASSDKL